MTAVTTNNHHRGVSAKEKDLQLAQEGQEEEEEPSWRTLFFDFTQSTSMHGLRFITLKTRFIIRRFVWILLTVGAGTALVLYLYDRVSFFLEFNKTVNVEVNYVDQMDFPAITLCNRNQFKLTSSVDGGYYDKVVNMTRSATSSAPANCTSGEFQCDDKCVPGEWHCDRVADCYDRTDEQHCVSEQCSYISITTSTTLADTPPYSGILNHNFQRDKSMSTYSRWLYYSLSDNGIVYLFYEDTTMEWIFSKSLNPYSIILSTQSNDSANTSVTPDQYVGNWENDNSTDVLTLNIICTEPVPEVQNIPAMATDPQPIHDLMDIYNYGAPTVDDIIQRCTWKGQACSPTDFHTVDTDMGRCFSYMPSSGIEQSGPGFGLGITVNIQLYEYTRSASESIGVQILLHNPLEPPVMSEKAFAISPGLNTLVAVERTQIENLPSPWGECEEKELEYYDMYSIPTCNLNCINQLARSLCGCRELYMPQSTNITTATGNYSFCTVDEFVTCWKPQLDQLKITGNYCSCATPCSELVLVPSLSFSSINTNTDALTGDQRQKLQEIKTNLIKARDINYRILEEKYMLTMRQFTTTIRQSALTATRHLRVEETALQELTNLQTVVAEVNWDCLWFMQEQHTLTLNIETDISHIIENLYHFLRETLYAKTAELSYLLTSIYTCWDVDTCGFRTCTQTCSPCSKSCTKDQTLTYNNMLRPWYTQTKNLITFIRNEIITQVTQNITDVLDANSNFLYVLDAGHIQPLLSNLRLISCGDWCTVDGSSVVTVLSDKLHTAVTDVNTALTAFETALDALHSVSLNNGAFLAQTGTARTTLDTSATDLTSQVNYLLSTVTQSMSQPMNEAVTIMKDLLRVITPKCDVELQRLFYGYLDEHNRMHSNVLEMKNLILDYGQQYQGFYELYKAYNLTLTDLYDQSKLTTTIASIQNLNYQMVSRFQERVISVQRIQEHISSLYYWISAQVTEETLANTSLLWQHFNISSPVLADTGATATVGTPIEATYSFSNADLTSFWEQTVATLETSRVSMEEGNTAMETQLTGIQEYLETFMAGNEISESFFKNNFLSVDIFYKELTDKSVSQQKAYEFPTLLGEIGGFMGLLLGISVMTILEFLDLLLYNSISKCTKYLQNNNQQVKNNHSRSSVKPINDTYSTTNGNPIQNNYVHGSEF